MTTSVSYDASRPIDDRYLPPDCDELQAVRDVLDDGRLSGGAAVLPLYERALARWFGVPHAVAVNSGSSALHAALVAFKTGPGTEVIVPATAPLPTVMPVLTCGATPVVVDTLPGSLALDPTDVERKLTVRTRAVITLPLWGYPANDHRLAALLAPTGVPIVEDACQAHGTEIAGRYAGTLGRVGCFSTHDRKLLSTGEGGFLLTGDRELAARLDDYTHLGHLRGATHGVNYKLAGPLAAIGLRRLEQLDAQITQRRANARAILDALPVDGRLRELHSANGDQPNYYNLVLVAESSPALIAAELAASGLPPDSVRYGYRPLHKQPLFRAYATECPNAEMLAATTLQLPCHPGMSPETIEWVARRTAAIARRGT
ncbi:DegT/DnrJ/EryC1/StrS family aminotransferase [Micromonospora sp. NBC_01796]|uniref:DegT/DnrJ/EryC1/StrS family aminotransferase n=1 Tax=Micromonospora sp. NBC_01796 TaxID=2975987 RepID=UPI002DDAB0E8|nr:DegT/DnrJ/EryC1/StrS family aminotransferase [Micromonospora sp. NBC_01796]WSA86455.1 DegT/DnrJ/EryC1/StrS family aminotransferase [Micromonospora sp. NBC_01796]